MSRHGLFLAWVDAPPPPMALSTGWAGGTPAAVSGLPGTVATAISPSDCNLTSHHLTAGTDATLLTMTLTHSPTSLRFHISASLGAGAAQTLNLSMKVELPGSTRTAQAAARPGNITLAFPYITGIAIGANGSSNAGINHFGTGLCTDGQLPAWFASVSRLHKQSCDRWVPMEA